MLERAGKILLLLVGISAIASAYVTISDPDSSIVLAIMQAVLVLAALVIYWLGLERAEEEAGPDKIVSPAQVLSFGLGIGVLVFILSPPVDEVTDALFSAHMCQHLVLMLVIPPLLVWSRPALVGLWALPRGTRKSFVASVFVRGFTAIVKRLMHPLITAMLFLGAFLFWHLPRPYAWSLENEWLHTLEHTTFLFSALMFWSLVIEPSGRRRMGYLATMLYVAAIAVLSGLPGALMVLSPVVLFRTPHDPSLAWGIAPIADQQIAGLIMWIPAGIFFLVPIAWLFVKSFESAERRELARSIAILGLLLAPAAFGGCSAARSSDEQAERAKQLIANYGCGTCHTVPGVDGATGRVGPPLAGIGDRIFVAGRLQNNVENMSKWIVDPQSVSPGTAMPTIGVKPGDAQLIARYLETLRDN